ncbi:MAG TPA: class I SAM-dependent RNA methyltransferase [Streptosporangiaceae bacterium]|nr:class I SAM-dependent RNA methyltransferase [Streptosporangiaceae bacterium]
MSPSDRVSYVPGQVVEVTAGDVAHGGWCVARPGDGPVVFVRHALPGERVLARITEVTARLARAEAVEILAASPDRVPPPCPHARPDGCGGCDWQHAALPAQRSLKAAVIRQQLRRMAGLDREITVEALPGDRDTDGGAGLGWRTRVQFAVREDGVAGLRAHRSHRVIDVGECLIAHQAITDLGLTGPRWPGVSSVEALVATGSGERAVIVSPDREAGGAARSASIQDVAADAVFRRAGPRNPRLTPVRGRGYLSQHAAGRDWRVSAGAFWQVHPAAADALTGAVLASLEPRPGDAALDLYCGAGLFAGVLAPAVGPGGTVIGVEADDAAVRDARHNLREWPWARVHKGDVASVLRRGGFPPTRLAVADPPRSGLAREVIDYLGAAEHAVGRLAYVSCDPATLARDIGLLADRGWTLDGLRAFDAFPMTHHVECVATLSASSLPVGQPGLDLGRDRVGGLVAVHVQQDAPLLPVVGDERARGLGEHLEPVLDHFGRVVGPGAGQQPPQQDRFGHVQVDGGVQGYAAFPGDVGRLQGLGHRAGESVQDVAAACRGGHHDGKNQVEDDLIRHQVAPALEGGDLTAQRAAGAGLDPQDLPGGDVLDAVDRGQRLGLCPLTAAWRADQQ